MPQIVYLSAADLPARTRTVYVRDGHVWRLQAVVVHLARDSDRETGRVAFLRRDDGKGAEWEIPWDRLRMVME
jgi:hypothetical protein